MFLVRRHITKAVRILPEKPTDQIAEAKAYLIARVIALAKMDIAHVTQVSSSNQRKQLNYLRQNPSYFLNKKETGSPADPSPRRFDISLA